MKELVKIGDKNDKTVHITAHILLLLLSEYSPQVARLNTSKSNLLDSKWVSGLRPILTANASLILNSAKQLRYAAINLPQTILAQAHSKAKAQTIANLKARLFDQITVNSEKEIPTAF